MAEANTKPLYWDTPQTQATSNSFGKKQNKLKMSSPYKITKHTRNNQQSCWSQQKETK